MRVKAERKYVGEIDPSLNGFSKAKITICPGIRK